MTAKQPRRLRKINFEEERPREVEKKTQARQKTQRWFSAKRCAVGRISGAPIASKGWTVRMAIYAPVARFLSIHRFHTMAAKTIDGTVLAKYTILI
jgi:hypothetical protein